MDAWTDTLGGHKSHLERKAVCLRSIKLMCVSALRQVLGKVKKPNTYKEVCVDSECVVSSKRLYTC